MMCPPLSCPSHLLSCINYVTEADDFVLYMCQRLFSEPPYLASGSLCVFSASLPKDCVVVYPPTHGYMNTVVTIATIMTIVFNIKKKISLH